MPAAPRVASVWLSEFEPPPDPRPRTVSVPPVAVTRALTQAGDFSQVLKAPARARTAHFVVHHLPQRPLSGKKPASSPEASDLSTATIPELSPAVDESPVTELWLGLVVPKRHAKRAVTRTLLKRRIRAAVSHVAAVLAPGLWVVRLRTPFDRQEFVSAASDRLARAASQELAALMASAAARCPR